MGNGIGWVVNELYEGRAVRRASWDKGINLWLDNVGVPQISGPYSPDYSYQPFYDKFAEDIFANDWVSLEG